MLAGEAGIGGGSSGRGNWRKVDKLDAALVGVDGGAGLLDRDDSFGPSQGRGRSGDGVPWG